MQVLSGAAGRRLCIQLVQPPTMRKRTPYTPSTPSLMVFCEYRRKCCDASSSSLKRVACASPSPSDAAGRGAAAEASDGAHRL
jgi:hypothetical protein